MICKKCNTDKDLDSFGKDKRIKGGCALTCKDCRNEKERNNYLKNKEAVSIRNKKWKSINKERTKELRKLQYDRAKLRPDFKEKERMWRKKYKSEHKEEIKVKRCLYQQKKRSIDPIYKLKGNIRKMMNRSIIKNGFTKKSRTYQLLGCSYEFVKQYLESKFEPWMNWNNHGTYNSNPTQLNQSWDIDHIIPLFTAETEEDLLKLFHYTNLQPLDSYTNRFTKKHHDVELYSCSI